MRLSLEQERIREIFARSRIWLLAIVSPDAERTQRSNDDLFKILLGVWICEHLSEQTQSSPTFHHLMMLVGERLRCEHEAGAFDSRSYDTKLLLLCHQILSTHHHSVYGIDHFAQQLAAALGELEPIPLCYMGEALLLAQLGYGEFPAVPTLQADEASQSACQLLCADKHQLRSVCNNISAATHFGRQLLRADAEVQRYLGRLLPVILLQSLRDYDLEMGTILLRTIRYLHLPRTRAIRLAIEFLIDQQQSDGRFGYFAIESAWIARSTELSSVDITSKLYLPMTVACLWSLAETLVPRFNLSGSPGLPMASTTSSGVA